MKHLILGAGNLGMDLHKALEMSGESATLLSRSKSTIKGLYLKVENGCLEPQTFTAEKAFINWSEIAALNFDVIWNTLGHGGPSPDFERGTEQLDLHFKFPVMLRKANPQTKLILFSTHYLNHDPKGVRSVYATSKLLMEKAFEKDKGAFIARIGSLYGKPKPLTCLPGKIVGQMLAGKTLFEKAAENRVSPTPTAWLARMLVARMAWKDSGMTSIAPAKHIPVRAWLERIITEATKQTGLAAEVRTSFVDADYPIFSGGGAIGEGPSVLGLWEDFGPKCVRAAVEQVRFSNHCR